MRNALPACRQTSELLIPFSILLILVWYTYGILLVVPYPGFSFNTSSGVVEEIHSPSESLLTLQRGDRIKRIGSVTWEEYRENPRVTFFEGVQAGDIVEIVVDRGGMEMVIPWKFAGFDRSVLVSRIINIWGLAYFFWFFGLLAQLMIRPRDVRRRLFIAVNYLLALFLMFGSLSSRHLWESAILLRVVAWLLLPVYLHLHWIYPKPLAVLPKFAIYAPAYALSVAELFQLLPRSLYAFGFILALAGGAVLQMIHFIWRPEQRRQVGLLVISMLLAILPAVVLGILRIFGEIPPFAPAALFSLPFIPLSYFYLIFRARLGGLEIRANRIISVYAFLILAASFLLVVLAAAMALDLSIEGYSLLALAIPLIVSVGSVTSYPSFKAFIEQRFLGVKLPYQNLQEVYASRISASVTTSDLLHLLESEIFPSLFIRQFAFLQASNGKLLPLLVKDVSSDQLPDGEETEELLAQAGKYIPEVSPGSGWVRLILPLHAGDSFIGIWLLGRRDPDDLYPQAEIPILQSIANQTAIALSNLLLAEQLRKMYQMDIERRERKQLRLALELHDSILNQLAVIRTSLDENNLPPRFKSAYDELTRRLREIISDLRPPMLIYGLKPAIAELADNLMERSSDKVKIGVSLRADSDRMPQQMEQHLFRIVQEACENALRHAGAKTIHISGTLTAREVDLTIQDDGKGFDPEMRLDPDALLNSDHFGIAGMIERARLIGAQISIHSTPGAGVRIRVTWRAVPA